MITSRAYLKFFLAAAAIGLLVFFSKSTPLIKIRAGIFWVLEPAMSLASGVRMALVGVPDGTRENSDSQRLKIVSFELERMREENKTLRSALAFEEESQTLLYGARVVSYLKEFGKEFLLVKASKEIVVSIGTVVVDGNGLLVGLVKEENNGFIKVEVASNSGLTLEVEIIPANVRAVARGLGSRTFAIELLPQDAPVRAGDFVAVAKVPFPLLLLAEITSVEIQAASVFKESKAVTISRPETLREVFLAVSRRP